ncbi:unnamed protein product, partial [Adineta steineri]
NIKRNDDAMKDWTEERKMVEVDKLLNTLDRAMTHGLIKPMVMDANGNPVPAESVLQLREANLLTHHPNDLRASESSDDEGDGGQINTNKSK